MKNTLAENMLRFGVKNLSESEIKKIAEQAAQAQKEFNEAALFDDLVTRGEIRIGTTNLADGFHVNEADKVHALFFREPVVIWDGQYGLVYAKTFRTQFNDAIPDPNTPAGKKWNADFEAKINASQPVITAIKKVGNVVVPDYQTKVELFGYRVLTYCASRMTPEGILGGNVFLQYSPGIKNNLNTYSVARLDQDIKAGKFGEPVKIAPKKSSIVKGFNLPVA
jgi:hypothetical protein